MNSKSILIRGNEVIIAFTANGSRKTKRQVQNMLWISPVHPRLEPRIARAPFIYYPW